MAFPDNIEKEHLLKAIEKIDKEGITNDGDSRYYDVIYNNRKYPPKLIVSFANIFANGKELDRNSFEGGKNTPCFKLLEKHGFKIIEKDTKIMKIKIYEVKSSSAPNAIKLLSPDGKYFYWNNAKFLSNEIGDIIFVVNRHANWALYTKIGSKDITARQDRVAQTASFNHEFNTYTVEDKDGVYNVFIRFDIVEKVSIPSDWNWSKPLGQSETYDLLKSGIEGETERLSKIEDLRKLFTDEETNEVFSKCEEFLGSSTNNDFDSEVRKALSNDIIKELLNEKDFHYQLAQECLSRVDTYQEPNKGFYDQILQSFLSSPDSYKKYIAKLDKSSNEYKLLYLLGELISYCDLNAADKKILNQYSDHRTLARSFVRQGTWIESLIRYKIAGNNLNALSGSVFHAIHYLKEPNAEITMLSDNHRAMVSKYILKKEYQSQSFIKDLLEYFARFDINPTNPTNKTLIVSAIFYRFNSIKQLWFERVEGLVAQDTTDWFESALDDIQNTGKIILWWSRVPTAKNKVDKLLIEQIKNNGYYYLFYTQNNQAVYRARVIDHAYENNYADKKWNINNDVEWHKDNFTEYKDDDSKKASIVFLVDEFIKLQEPIPIDKFEFYTGEAPRQINLQPYTELDWVFGVDPKVWFVTQGATFREERGMKFLWAPEKGKDGNGRFYWDNVLKVKKGDIIFNYSEGLQGVSMALSDGYKANNNDPDSEWGPEGYKVDIAVTPLNPIISGNTLAIHKSKMDDLLANISNKPFNVNGGVNQGYLYEFSKEAGRYIRDIYGKMFGNKTVDDFFDKVMLNKPSNTSKMDFNHKYRKEICAIKTKPFLLMAGISGTGKSRMVRTLAYKTCPQELRNGNNPGNFINISVKPNWHDSIELIGYVSRIDGTRYIVTDFLKFIIKAWSNLDTPFFVCLDEMNLAPVEQYFAEYLSKIESRKKEEGGKITTDAMITSDTYKKYKENFKEDNNIPNQVELIFENTGIGLPPNLVIIGTVNMDETTHSFSRKVLDRAMTFEKNLDNDEGILKLNLDEEDWNYNNQIDQGLLLVSEIKPNQTIIDEFVEFKVIIERLNAINKILNNSSFMIAYRTLDEAIMYTYHNSLCSNKPGNWIDQVMDDIILMKILPRIEGDETRTLDTLMKLEELFINTNAINSRKKCGIMLSKLKASGYTSFWN